MVTMKTCINSPCWFSADFRYNMMLAVAGTNAIGTAAPKPSVQASLRCWWWYCLRLVWADSCRGTNYWMYQNTYLVVSSFYSSAPMPLAQQHPNQACRPHWDVSGDSACAWFGRILAGVRSIECTNTPIQLFLHFILALRYRRTPFALPALTIYYTLGEPLSISLVLPVLKHTYFITFQTGIKTLRDRQN
jgi:hypothetical protein